MTETSFGCGFRFVAALIVASALVSGCGGDDSSGSTLAEQPASPNTPPPSAQNAAPKISGKALTSVSVGEEYKFQPNATDPDQDLVTFTIANKPKWAKFDAESGLLSGTPAAKDAGGYGDIEIAATDGTNVTPLPAFTVLVRTADAAEAVSIAWSAPTKYIDGATLTDLAGYRIHYGKESQNYENSVDVSNSSLTRYVLESLPPGKYYFALTALSGSGGESPFSEEVVATLN
jgi:hypothetical protein